MLSRRGVDRGPGPLPGVNSVLQIMTVLSRIDSFDDYDSYENMTD